MKLIKVAAAVLNQTPLAWEENQAHIAAAIESARDQNVSILCLPELCICGYGCEDAFYSPGMLRAASQSLLEIVPETRGMVVSLGLPVLHAGGLFNCACLVADGKLIGLVAKQNLAGDGIHYEPRWFKPWPRNKRDKIDLDGLAVPIGDLIFDCGGVRLGFEVCEDAWVGDRPGHQLAARGVDIIMNPSASHFAFGKHEIRKRFVLEGSRAFNTSYIYANLLGNEAGRAIYDGDAMIASAGKLLAVGSRFSFADTQLTTAVLDVDATQMSRVQSANYEPDIKKSRTGTLRVAIDYPTIRPESSTTNPPDWENGQHVKEEEFLRAVSLGLFDYMRKSRSRGLVVSLSGGADSAAVATLGAMMVHLGVGELGRAIFLEKLSYIDGLKRIRAKNKIVQHLVSCVYQSTRNSGDVTHKAAKSLAKALGVEFLEFDVDAIVESYIGIVQQAVGRDLTWDSDDIALQNIQARARAPGIWMLANLKNALLLSTSNRSEAAVGYATMDGDTSGGLAPIAGIDKAFLRQWLNWMEVSASQDAPPIETLRLINEQQPTAELRPPSASQTDEDDLMPYELLDAIERAAIRDKLTPIEVFQQMESQHAYYDRQQLATWVERFFRLWCRNQWKRERYAPSFHLDDENLDPKTWCRFPILSGGFSRELDELRKYVEEN